MASVRRVRIVQLSPEALASLAAGDLAAARRLMAPSVGESLSAYLVAPESVSTWRRRATQVVQTPVDLDWVTGVVVDEDTGETVGRAGFHAAPDADGMVEVGYAIDPAHRRRGYARAALLTLLERARTDPAVHTLRATVSPTNHASLALIRSLPFVEVGEQRDDEDGLEAIYELPV